MNKWVKGGERQLPGKLKDRLGNWGNKWNYNNSAIPGKLKNRFSPYGDKGPHKNNGAGRKLGKSNVLIKVEIKKMNLLKKQI